MPKILCISPYVPHPVTHGGSIRTRLLLDALRSVGEVHLCAPVSNHQERADAQYLAQAIGVFAHELDARPGAYPGKLSKMANWLRGESDWLSRRWTPASKATVSQLLRTFRFDLVVADGSHTLPLLHRFDAPLLFHLHNVESAILDRPPAQPMSLRARVVRRMERKRTARIEAESLRRAVISVTVSDLDRQSALRLCPSARIVTVPNAVEGELSPIGSTPKQGPLRLLFVGRLDYPPNLEAVTELVERHLPVLRREFPGLVVRVVGEDSSGATERLRRDGVEFLGRVSDLLPHYAESHAAYIPLRSGGGTRLKILEAFSMGLPVASTAVGAEGLDAKDGVHFRKFETPDEGVAALRELLGERRDSYVAKARALVQATHSRSSALAALRTACSEALTTSRSRSQASKATGS